ncbi:MAG: hypothetical protein V1886_01015 [archaeon]
MAETNVRNAEKKINLSEEQRALKALEELRKEVEEEPESEESEETEDAEKTEESDEQDSKEESEDISGKFSKEFESELFDSAVYERHAPVLKQEELEERVSSAPGRKENDEDKKDKIDYSFEKPKYSFSYSEDDEELKRAVLRQTPSLIERAQEAREIRGIGLRDSMLVHNESGAQENEMKYVRDSGEHILEKSDEARDKSVDIRKYSKNR